MRLACRFALLLVALLASTFGFGQQLEIHYINVGWGSSVLVKGPDGTTVLLEAGNTGKGNNEVVPYLNSVGILPANGLDYTIAGHQHCDHIGGLDEVINAGYNVRTKNYYNGSNYSSTCVTGWNTAAAGTSAGAPVAMTVGTQILLGSGAKLTCVAAKGQIIGGGSVAATNENDLSIAVLIQYGGFDYLWASDLGGGTIDEACTGRSTTQVDVETSVVQAISPSGAAPMISSGGIDVLNINHHGSESSTNNNWFDYSAPAVAIIPTGAGQNTGWDLPRVDIVHNVLLANATACVEAPPTFVLQTEEGSPTGSLTSFEGYCVGNIKVTTDGANLFTVSGDGDVTQGPNEVVAAGLPRSFTLDDAPPDTEPPSTSITAPANGATVSNTIMVTASATDNVAVSRVEFYLDGALKSTDTTTPYEWSWDTTTTPNGSHDLQSKAYDSANNVGSSAINTVTVNNAVPPGTDISGWKVTQANSTSEFILPAGTVVADHGYVIIARNASRASFEAFWGITLGSNVLYFNSGDTLPLINGDEKYTLYNAAGTKKDGQTVSMDSAAGKSFRRNDPCNSPGKLSSWTVGAATTATPGSGAGAGCAGGVKINEFSDASGTGNFIYEFVELHNDK